MVFNLNIVDLTIVLRPARSKAQVPGFDRVTGSAGSVLFFKKNQNDVVLEKKKSMGLQPSLDRVLPGQPGRQVNPPGQPGFSFPRFFFNPGQPGPGSTRWAGPGFKTMDLTIVIIS
jgi:hypothetical protein